MKTGKAKTTLEKPDWADNLSFEQKKKLKEGLEDIKAGRTASSEKFWARYGRKK
jgi:hypothetical protein